MERMIRIFDTTLRDGEQSPGASMNVEEKVIDRKSTRLNSSHMSESRMPSSA